MLKREIFEALKRFAEACIILLTIPLVYLYLRYVVKEGFDLSELATYIFFFSSFAYAFWAGATIFQHEFRDKAFEYMFSLPLSRWRILWAKLLPRLVLLLVLIAADVIFLHFDMQRYFLLIFIFFASAFLSAAIQTFFLQMICAVLFYSVFHGVLKVVSQWAIHWDFLANSLTLNQFTNLLLAFILVLLPIALSFYLFYRKFDLKPLNLHLRPYLYILLPWLVFLVALYFHAAKK